MASEEDILYLYLLYRIYKRNKRRRRFWVNPANQDRDKYGIVPIYPRLVNDVEEFYVYTKMTPDIFDDLCAIVSPEIRKINTNFREAIPPRERLLMTLRFLASGESFRSLSYQFRVGTSTIRQIIYETCEAIWKRCHAKEVPTLEKADYKAIGADFESRWNFPNCAGCVVGKKIRINAPSRSNNDSSTSKSKTSRSSIILQGVADAWGNFVAIDVGDYEKQGDSGSSILRQTSFGKALINDKLDLPLWDVSEGSDDELPFVFIGSINYPMLPRLLRPFPKRDLTVKRKLFNDRFSYAHKCADIAFGALVDRWGVLKSPMSMDPAHVCNIVRACCILHNFVRRRTTSASSGSEMPSDEEADDMLDILPNVTSAMVGRPRDDAIAVRDSFATFLYQSEQPPFWKNRAGDGREPVLELECQEDETTPMDEQEYDEEREELVDYSGEKPKEDQKPEDCLSLNPTKSEDDLHCEPGAEFQSNGKPKMRNWPESSRSGRQDLKEPTSSVLQCAADGQSSLDAEQEIDVKPEIIYIVKNDIM